MEDALSGKFGYSEQGAHQQKEKAAAAAAGKLQKAAAEEIAAAKRMEVFESGMYEVERMLGQFVCPSHVAAPPSRGPPGSKGLEGEGDKAQAAEDRKAAQLAYAERLYLGSSFEGAHKLPPRQLRVPPAKQLEKRLSMLRADAAARETLRVTVAKHQRDIRAEHMLRCGGLPRNFVQENTSKVTANARPRSAPVLRALAETQLLEPIEIGKRPAFRPGGAPAEVYMRPGPAPPVYGRRPQSAAAPSRRSTAPLDAEAPLGPVDAVPDAGPRSPGADSVAAAAQSPIQQARSPTRGVAAPPASATLV